MYEELLKLKKLVPERLPVYGFAETGDHWEYGTSIMDGGFDLTVCISESGSIDTTLVEKESGDTS